MRAIAIAIVVLAHAHVPGFSGGFVGVDIFFVLSGYLITGLLVKERLDTGRIRYGSFLARRLRRLLPALLLMLVVVFLLALQLLSSFEVQMQTGALPYATTWTSNFYFAFAEFDYFAALKAKDLFLHTWSLGIEEQFYLVWPWLVALAFAMTVANSRPDRVFRSLLALIAVVFTLGLALCLYWAQTKALLAFYMMPARGWQFALGASVFAFSARQQPGWTGAPAFPDANKTRHLAGVAGLGLLLGSAIFLHSRLNYPGYYALFPSIGAALLIHAASGERSSAVNQFLSARAFVWLGDRSYSLYLWHWPVLMLGGAYGVPDQPFGSAALISFAILLAIVSYRWIELPFWKGRYSAATPRIVALSSLLAVSAVCWLATSPGSIDAGYGTPSSAGSADQEAGGYFVAGFDCDGWFHNSTVLPCRSGNPDAGHTVVLIGDSIGAQWAPLLPEIYKDPDWRILVLTKSACTFADLEYYYQPAGGLYDVCTKWRSNSIDYLQELQPDIVFFGSASVSTFTEFEWVGGTERIIARLASVTPHVVIIPGTPALSFHGPSCLKEPYRFTSRLRDSRYICEEAMSDRSSDDIAGYLDRAARSSPIATVLNLNDLVCPGQRCAARSQNGLTVFRDSSHLTASFVHAQAPAVLARLELMQLGPSALQAAAVPAN